MKSTSPSSTSSSRDTTDNGLVATPDELLTSRGPRRVASFVIGVFLTCLVATAIVDRLWPAPAPELTGIERQADEQRRRSARLRDGSLTSLLEYDVRLRSRVRTSVTPYYAYALFAWLGAARDNAVVGSDGWLFHRVRAVPPDYPNRVLAGYAAARLAAVDRCLARLGVRLLIAPIPRKSVACAEYLPAGFDARPELDERLARDLTERGVEVADLLGAFRAQPGVQLFYQADGHWTEEAELIAAEAIVRAAGMLVPEEERETTVRERRLRWQKHNILRYIGIELERHELKALRGPDVPALDVFRPGGWVEHANPTRMSRVAIVGTSYTARTKLAGFLAHFSGRTVWNAARPGTNPIDLARRLLRDHARRLPELLILEIPGHLTFAADDVVAELCAEHPPRTVTFVREARRTAGAQREELEVDGRRLLSRVPSGSVGHSGAGTVLVRARGEVRGGPLRLEVSYDTHRWSAPWKPGQTEIVLPVLSFQATSADLSIAAVPEAGARGRLRLESVDVVTALDEAGSVTLQVGDVALAGGGWTQTLIAPEVGSLRGALWIELGDAIPQSTTIRVDLVADGELASSSEWSGMRPNAALVLDLDALGGANLDEVRLTGSGTPRRAVAAHARLLPRSAN